MSPIGRYLMDEKMELPEPYKMRIDENDVSV